MTLGPINAVDPDPFPAPQVGTYSYSTTVSSDWGGPSWGMVRNFLLDTTVEALTADIPEVRIVSELPSTTESVTKWVLAA